MSFACIKVSLFDIKSALKLTRKMVNLRKLTRIVYLYSPYSERIYAYVNALYLRSTIVVYGNTLSREGKGNRVQEW